MATTNFQPTTVNHSGLTALIKNLGRDCTPHQFLREFTMNAIEACIRTGEKNGRVEVDYNAHIYEKSGLYKISFTDNGDGMDQDQMVNLLNSLSASGSEKNQFENYGVGAKISALTRNHKGIQYESWRDDIGYSVILRYNEEENLYGLQGFSDSNGNTEFAPRISNANKPKIINEHGTRVTLFGMEDDQDTMLPPEGIGGIRESWIALFLNSRFFQIPDNVNISARIGYYRNNTRHNYLLNVIGQKKALDSESLSYGKLKITDALIHWWIMPKNANGHGRTNLRGHTALVNQNEVFDISDARSNRHAHFGIIYGRDQVVIYVEPEKAVQNTSRTGLVKPDGSPIQWDAWEDEFRENMPPVLRQFLNTLIEENSKESHFDNIRDRLKELKDLFKISRYRPHSEGNLLANPDSEVTLSTGHERIGSLKSENRKPSSGLKSGSLATELLSEQIEDSEGIKVVLASPDPFPRVEWTDEDTNGLIDRAAEYLPKQNLIIANKDFQGIRDVVAYFSRSYKDLPDVLNIIEDAVREAFEQVLIECVAGALALKNRPHWNISEFEKALSQEALTTIVMQRYWIVNSIRRKLSKKIKGFSEQLT